MKTMTFIFLFVVSSIFSGNLVYAHGGGHSRVKAPPVSKAKTVEIGKYHIERLIKAGKLDKSWKNAKHEASVEKKYKDRKEWVVTYNNEKGVKGKKLYIFLLKSGEFIAANFTGK